MKASVQEANPYDHAIVAMGILAFIFSLFSYYKYTASNELISVSATTSAWHGFFGWFAALVALVASLVLAAGTYGQVRMPFPHRLGVFVAYVVAAVCVILALFVVPGESVSGIGYDKGHGWAYWVSLIVILVGAGLAFMRKDATD
jgi:hypothetical protein